MENLKVKLIEEAHQFANDFSKKSHNKLFGITDGKAIGTYIENLYKDIIKTKYGVKVATASNGIDIPNENIDIKCTLTTRPQSSCPYKSFRQKVYGLGYSILLFTYIKNDNFDTKECKIIINGVYYISENETSDTYITENINYILDNSLNKEEELIELFKEVKLPADDFDLSQLAKEVLINRPNIGKLTISNALQWRLQYSKIVNN